MDLQDEDARIPAATVHRMWRSLGVGWGSRKALAQGGMALEEWVASIGRLKGIAMKMGQIMSYIDVAIPPEAQRALAALQTSSASMSLETVEEILAVELGDAAKRLELDPIPAASASIGQVHRAVVDGQHVAVKVQYPEVEAAIRSDFRLASIGPTMARLFAPTARVKSLVDEAQRQFLLECDYEHEAEAQRRMALVHAADRDIVIPSVYADLSTKRVLVTQWIDGVGLEPFMATDPSQAARDRVGQALHRFYVGALLRYGIYNGDPHPGNHLYLPDGRVAILDHGCTRSFDNAAVGRLARLSLADDEPALDAAIKELGIAHSGKQLEDARLFMRAFYRPFNGERIEMGEVNDMARILANKRRLMTLRLPGEFLFLLRIRFGLASVLATLDARGPWRAREREWAQAAASQ